MPELPEVEVLRRSLVPHLEGITITLTEVLFPVLREPIDLRSVISHTQDGRIRRLRRRAKYLLIEFENNWTLVVHLGMSGQLTLSEGGREPEPHEHLRFTLSDGRLLRFRDPRRFGMVFVVPTDELPSDRHFAHLGIEPLEGELTGAYLARESVGRSAPVKSFLMDNRRVVGVGNIYACEALHLARIHPKRSVGRISAQRWDLLAGAVRTVLQRAIDEGGTTLKDFRDGTGQSGYFRVSLEVYDRAGKPCRRCGRVIRRIVQTGRSSFYCPGCQR